MVQRLHQAGQSEGWPAGESLPARFMWGPLTPTDRAAVLDEVVKGVGASVLSVDTGIRMLIDAGTRSTTDKRRSSASRPAPSRPAARFADATRDNAAAPEYLGLPKAGPELPRISSSSFVTESSEVNDN